MNDQTSRHDALHVSLADLRLRSLGFLTRVGLSFGVLVMLGGYMAAGVFLMDHHGPRDGRPGLQLDDIEGVYHGVTVAPRLLGVLESGHPGNLPANVPGAGALTQDQKDDVAHLVAWLKSGRVQEDWNNIDLGDGYGAPSEVLVDACAKCHGRGATAELRAAPTLEYWDDVAKLALPREVLPTDKALLLASTHAHGPAMAMISIVAVFLSALTFWPRFLVGLLAIASGLGLIVDLGAWWIARETAGLAWLIVAGGAAHAFGTCALFGLVLLELWRPFGRR
ncbi:MAG: hypothetical protein R3F49_14500 [Planctomycetota bacterium]